MYLFKFMFFIIFSNIYSGMGISRSYGTQSFGSSHGKESAYLCRRFDFNLWVGRIPWIRQWKTTPYSYLENSTGRGAWWAIVHGVAKSLT